MHIKRRISSALVRLSSTREFGEQARDFYLHLAEFDASPTDPLHLVVLMREIKRITG